MDKFEALDIFKLIPVSASWFAGIGVLGVLNPLGYTDAQYYTYGFVGATIGGLYSIAYLGGLAKGGNKAGLKKMAMVMAIPFIMDAPIVRCKVIDITINPKYSEYKKEYLQIPKTENLNKLENLLLDINTSYTTEKARLENLDIEKKNRATQQAKSEYLANYKKYSWWRNKAEQIGCRTINPLLANQDERNRRISCIVNEYYKPSTSKTLKALKIKLATIKSKIALIKNKNINITAREAKLKKEIEKAENQTLPMFAFYIIMFFAGWGLEVFLPHLKFWREWQNYDAQKKGKTVSQYQEEKQEENNQKLLEHTDKFLTIISTQKDALLWVQKVLGSDAKINAKIATFFAVIFAIKNDEEKLVISTVNNYSWFRNPKTNKKYNLQNHTTRVVKLFKKNNITKNNMPILKMEEILKIVKNL